MQIVTAGAIKFFGEKIKNKYNLKEYKSTTDPTLFFGIYSTCDTRRVLRHTGEKIVLLNGSDSLKEENVLSVKKSGAHIIAGSSWVVNDLIRYGIEDFTYIPFFVGNIYDWKPEPLGDSLYWYGGGQTKYGKRYVSKVRAAFPDLNIIVADSNTYPQSEMADIYKKCFAGIRLVEHDGMSHTVSEMGLMGRQVIWNGETPFTVKYTDIDDVIKKIGILREKKDNYKLIARRARGFLVKSDTIWCDLLLRLFRTKELDAAGIFNESVGRCGSIFRIQRRSDIEKIGGFGTKQFERPWFSDQMRKLGKKELITSKNSGFIVSEWKGMNNKGYRDGFKSRTYDEKYG